MLTDDEVKDVEITIAVSVSDMSQYQGYRFQCNLMARMLADVRQLVVDSGFSQSLLEYYGGDMTCCILSIGQYMGAIIYAANKDEV